MTGARYAKTEKGIAEISERRNNLRGKMRMMLILVDPGKPANDLIATGERIGVPGDFLDIMAREGYIAPVNGVAHNAVSPAPQSPPQPVPERVNGSDDVVAAARQYMEQTLKATPLSRRGTELLARLPQCADVAALSELIAEYEHVMSDVAGAMQADALASRLRKMLR